MLHVVTPRPRAAVVVLLVVLFLVPRAFALDLNNLSSSDLMPLAEDAPAETVAATVAAAPAVVSRIEIGRDAAPLSAAGNSGGAFKVFNMTGSSLSAEVNCGDVPPALTTLNVGENRIFCFFPPAAVITYDENPAPGTSFRTVPIFYGQSARAVVRSGKIVLEELPDGRLSSHDGRFSSYISWAFGGGYGTGRLVNFQTNVAGFFTYDDFDPQDFQLIVKVINGCGGNGNGFYWLFAAGATNLYVTVTSVDRSGKSTPIARTYSSPLGQAMGAIDDVHAFNGCP